MGKIVRLSFSMLMSLALFSCLPKSKRGDLQTSTFRIGQLGPIYNLNLHSQSKTNFWEIQTILYQSLLKRDTRTGEIVSGLAEVFEWRNEHGSLYFRLKDNLVWSDGRQITSEDVRFTITSHGDPKYESIYFGVYKQRVERFEKVNDREFIVHLKNKSPGHLLALGLNLLIYPKHHFEDKKSGFPPTSGSFQFTEFVPGRSLRLAKRQDADGWVGIQSLEYKWFDSFRGLLAAAKASRIDFFEVDSPIQFIKAEKKLMKARDWQGVKAEGFALRGRHALIVNHKNELLSQQSNRELLLSKMNLKEIQTKLFKDLLEVAEGPWSADHPAYEKVTQKTEEASATITQALAGKSFKIISMSEEFESILTVFQQQLKQNGIGLEIQRLSFLEAMKAFETGEADMAYIYSPWVPYEINLASWYKSSSDDNPWTNPGNFKDEKLDKIIEAAEREFDSAKRLKLQRQAFERLAALMPDLFLFNNRYKLYFVNERVKRPQDTLKYSLGSETWSLLQAGQ